MSIAGILWFTKGRRAQNVNDYETWIEAGVAPTLNTFDNGDVRTTVIVFSHTQGLDIQPSETLSPTLRAQGNGMATSTTLRFRGGKPGGGKGPLLAEGISQVLTTPNDQILFNSNVRRLTPVECERLQGFPDNWTEGQADSHRYKQMGNAVAVPVVEWIIQNICDTI